MQVNRASVRHEVLIHRPADAVWELVGDPARIQEWFPGITASHVEDTHRVVTTAGGQQIPETILTLDPLQRRFQYEIRAPMCRFHLATLDVIALGDDTCLVIYGTDADPATVALTIAGGAAAALRNLASMFEGAT